MMSRSGRSDKSNQEATLLTSINKGHRPSVAIRRQRPRAILKSGDCNVLQENLSHHQLKFLQDIFTTLVDLQWRLVLLIFALSFLLSWLFFAIMFWLISLTHGDLEEIHLPPMQEANGWRPCIINIYSFTSCFLYSLESQHTIGYGVRAITEECPEAVFVSCMQAICGVLVQAFMAGIVFAKLTRPKSRCQTLLFSRSALICQRDGDLCLMFRVGDMRKSHIIGANIRAQLIHTRVTPEGERIKQYHTELDLKMDDCDSNLFLIWPVIVVHKITPDSPLYNLSPYDIMQDQFEILVFLEGTIESTGQSTQARTSYLNTEILWGYRFQEIANFSPETRVYEIDYSKFNEIIPVETPFPLYPPPTSTNMEEVYQTSSEIYQAISALPETPQPVPNPVNLQLNNLDQFITKFRSHSNYHIFNGSRRPLKSLTDIESVQSHPGICPV
ncbi:G protein-activated inward rectifier potassium channel 3-like [Lutzomyia longipalpis]|uniref:G protein-activated inward rectifier potassium channel 3-like n=1 Tax=Lutzomyia longipalpis TaxID=7200 RepID=UPI002483B6A0|nr:G protein-activated inward rectifier potassium channel 3-like [Lutzomyia longipalpis]